MFDEAVGIDLADRPNLELVTERIARVKPDGVVTDDGRERRLDTLILATGFATTRFLSAIDVVGRGGRTIRDAWRDGAQAYLGITTAGFPNLFMLYGPNTNLGHNSILYMLEAQAHYILSAIKLIRDGKAHYLDVKPEPLRLFREELKQRFHGTVWEADCTSWYKTATGEQTNNWPGLAFSYRLRTRRLNLADYETGR